MRCSSVALSQRLRDEVVLTLPLTVVTNSPSSNADNRRRLAQSGVLGCLNISLHSVVMCRSCASRATASPSTAVSSVRTSPSGPGRVRVERRLLGEVVLKQRPVRLAVAGERRLQRLCRRLTPG